MLSPRGVGLLMHVMRAQVPDREELALAAACGFTSVTTYGKPRDAYVQITDVIERDARGACTGNVSRLLITRGPLERVVIPFEVTQAMHNSDAGSDAQDAGDVSTPTPLPLPLERGKRGRKAKSDKTKGARSDARPWDRAEGLCEPTSGELRCVRPKGHDGLLHEHVSAAADGVSIGESVFFE